MATDPNPIGEPERAAWRPVARNAATYLGGVFVFLAWALVLSPIGAMVEELLLGPSVSSPVWFMWSSTIVAALIATLMVGRAWGNRGVVLVGLGAWGLVSARDYLAVYSADIEATSGEKMVALLLFFSVVASGLLLEFLFSRSAGTRAHWSKAGVTLGLIGLAAASSLGAVFMNPPRPLPVGTYEAVSPSSVAVAQDTLRIVVRDNTRQTQAYQVAETDAFTRYRIDGRPVSLPSFLKRTDIVRGSTLVDVEVRRVGTVAALSWDSE